MPYFLWPGPYAGAGETERIERVHPLPGRLVGRTAESARLESALESAREGVGSAVLITGDAGIGKSRFVSEFAEHAGRSGATVLAGRCLDLIGTGLPYLAIMEALRGSPAWTDRPPEFGAAGGPATSGDSSDNQPRLFDEVRGFLGRLASTAPLVLILEDLHWADASTLDVVGYLAYLVGSYRWVIVATYRDDEIRPGDPLPRLTATLLRAPSAIHVPLGPLSRDETTMVIEQARKRAVSRDLVESIVDRSGGNPFFAEELLGAAERGEEALPHLLRDTLLSRILPLDADTRFVLQAAAAVGRDVGYDLLAAVACRSEQRLQRALRHAVEQRVLVANQRSGTFWFRHALLAEAVYATLIPGEHEELHARIAEALVRQHATSAELAHHWAAARRPADALAASIMAARDAEAFSGRAEALAHLERALTLWPLVDEADVVAGIGHEAVLRWAAELASMTGAGRRAAELIRWALHLRTGDSDPFEAAILYERLGMYLLPTGDRKGGLAALERAVELVPSDPPTQYRVRVLSSLGQAMILSQRFVDARTACEEAIAVAQALGDPPPPQALDIVGNALCYLGRADVGLKILADACARNPEATGPRDLVRPFVYYSDALTAVGRPADAARVARDGLVLARRLGIERGVGNVLAANAAEALLSLGNWSEVEEVLKDALRSGGHFWSFGPHCRRAQLAIGRGEVEVARWHLEAGSQAAWEPDAAQDYYSLRAELSLWEGDLDAAAAAVDGGRAAEIGSDPPFLARLCALGLRAEADRIQLASAQRDRAVVESARRRATTLRREAQTRGIGSPDVAAWRAAADAEHSRALGRADPERWRAAVEAWIASIARTTPPIAAFASPKPCSRPIVRTRIRAFRLARRTGSRPAWELCRSNVNSVSSPNERASNSTNRSSPSHSSHTPRSGSPPGKGRCSACLLRDTPTDRSRIDCLSASRPRACTFHTSLASSVSPGGSRRPR